MRYFKTLAIGLCTSALLAACGGGGDGDQSPKLKITSMVSFGDSLTDIGTYKVGTIAALGGGKWTVNSSTAKNWTDLIAAQYGLSAPCAAQTGLPYVLISGFAGAPITNVSGCRNYAQGSARVSNPAGPGSYALQQTIYNAYGGSANAVAATTAAASAAPLGFMSTPVATQMSNHLAASGGSYSGNEIVTVLAGANDVFMHVNGVSAAAAGGSAAVLAAKIAGWSDATQATVAAGGAAAATAAQGAAVQGMAAAATELATLIKTQVLGKGAKYVAVVNIPDIAITPMAVPQGASAQALITALVTTFNTTLQNALTGTANVVLVDAYTVSHDQYVNPAQYGLSNVSTTACDTASAANPLKGSSITCTAASTVTGDTSHYLFADSVHPTPYGYQLLAELVNRSLLTAGWL